MKTILVLGAGLSSSTMLRYLLQQAETNDWMIHVVDQNQEMLAQKLNKHPRSKALSFNALDPEARRSEMIHSDLVISMLPARFHIEVAKDCIALQKNLITPSYISPEMKNLDAEAKAAGILIMNEIGVDPGIDHMSACKILDEIKEKDGKITSFKSFCGGLIAPESDNNCWNYKFTWNPRNVVLAGQGGAAKFIEQNLYKYIPYNQLFQRLDTIEIENYGRFEGYANRDSLSYRSIYNLDHIPTIYRGTLRRPGFAQGWNVFVNMGMTDDSYTIENSASMTPKDFINTFLPFELVEKVEDKFRRIWCPNSPEIFEKFASLGFFDDTNKLGIENGTPAQILEQILVKHWSLEPEDKDMLVMHHEFKYEKEGKIHTVKSSMVNLGEDQTHTAMSNTVGLPVAICAKGILTEKIQLTGVHLPVLKEIYTPILEELESLGIHFKEEWDA